MHDLVVLALRTRVLGFRGIEFGLGDILALPELALAPEFLRHVLHRRLGSGEPRFFTQQRSLRRFERGSQVVGIESNDHLSLLDTLALAKRHRNDARRNLGGDINFLTRLDHAGRTDNTYKVAPPGVLEFDERGLERGIKVLADLVELAGLDEPNAGAADANGDDKQGPKDPFPHANTLLAGLLFSL